MTPVLLGSSRRPASPTVRGTLGAGERQARATDELTAGDDVRPLVAHQARAPDGNAERERRHRADDEGGLVDFKRANPWLAEVDVLPFNQIWVNGERSKSFAGSGVDRLVPRLRGLLGTA